MSLAKFAVLTLLAAVPGSALESQAEPPSPVRQSPASTLGLGAGAQGVSLFVGRYGEVIEIPSGWAAKAESRGALEVVYLHPKSHDEFGFKPFSPARSEYKPENFSKQGLMELLVIPKDAPGGLKGLAEIRAEKEKELRAQEASFEIIDETHGSGWPRGTFHVKMEKPDRLWQTYSESAREFYILTAGRLESGDFGLDERRVNDFWHAHGVVESSLRSHLLARNARPDGVLFSYPPGASEDLFAGVRGYLKEPPKAPLTPRALTVAAAFLALLALWPGRSPMARRTRLFGCSLLGSGLLGGAAGFLTVYLPARFLGATWRSDELSMLAPVLIAPAAAWAVARVVGAQAGRAAAATGILAVAWTVLALWGADHRNVDPPADLALWNGIGLFLIGLTFGVAFALGYRATGEASR